jgi:outer membrane receptor protein involved in Fe transport
MAGAFSDVQWSATERLTLRAALRADVFQSAGWQYDTHDGSHRTLPSKGAGRINPALSMSYALLPSWVVRGSVYAGANPPTHLELSPMSSIARDPVLLDAERVVGGEVGFDVHAGPLSFFANIFQQNLRHGITDNGMRFDYALVNGENRRSRGVEVAGEWSPRRSITVRASHTYLSAIIIENPFDGLSPEYVALVGNPDQNVPIHTLAGSIRGQLPRGMRGMLRGRYQSRYTRLLEFGPNQPAPLAVVDASLAVPLARDFELSIRGENVLNRRYGITDFRRFLREAAPSLVMVGLRLTPQR